MRLNYGAYFTVSYSIVLYTTIEYDWNWKNSDLGEEDALLGTPSSSLVGYGLEWVGWDVRFVPLSFLCKTWIGTTRGAVNALPTRPSQGIVLKLATGKEASRHGR